MTPDEVDVTPETLYDSIMVAVPHAIRSNPDALRRFVSGKTIAQLARLAEAGYLPIEAMRYFRVADPTEPTGYRDVSIDPGRAQLVQDYVVLRHHEQRFREGIDRLEANGAGVAYVLGGIDDVGAALAYLDARDDTPEREMPETVDLSAGPPPLPEPKLVPLMSTPIIDYDEHGNPLPVDPAFVPEPMYDADGQALYRESWEDVDLPGPQVVRGHIWELIGDELYVEGRTCEEVAEALRETRPGPPDPGTGWAPAE